MEPTDKQSSDNSWSNNRELLRLLEQERRRRQAAPEEKYPLWEQTPLFAKPYKTDKEDELSRRMKNLLGDVGSKVLLSHESPGNPVWIPEKPKPKSHSSSHRPASSKTNPYADIWRESSPESLDLTPNPEQTYDDSDEGHSKQRSEVKAAPSKILPGPVKPILHVYVQSIEGILKVGALQYQMSTGKPLQIHEEVDPPDSGKGETPSVSISKTPESCFSPSLSRKCAAHCHLSCHLFSRLLELRLPNSHCRQRALQWQQRRRVAPAQRRRCESGSTRDCHSSSALCDRGISSSDSEEDDLPRVLVLPAREPKPSTSRKWHLDNLVTQTKRGAVPREGPRDTGCGNGREERKKPELGISSNSCQQHSKAREPPHKICGHPDKKSQTFFCPVARNSEKSSGKGPTTSQKSCGQETKNPHKNFGQGSKDFHKSSGQETKDFHKSSGKVVRDSQESCRQVAKYPEKSSGQVTQQFRKSPGHVAKEIHKINGKKGNNFHKSCGQVSKDSDKSFCQVKDSQKSGGQMSKAPQDAHLQSKQSCLKPPVLTKEAVPRNTAGIKRPGEPLVHSESKRVWNVEINPGPWQVTDQSCKDQLKDKKTLMPKATASADLKLALHEPSEKTKDKGSHQANARGFLDPRLPGDAQRRDTLIPSGHRPGDVHQEKVPLPPEEEKLFLAAVKPDLKRKAMRSPEESPGKKKSIGSCIPKPEEKCGAATAAGHDCCTTCAKLDHDSHQRPRSETDGPELPAVDNPARNQDPQNPGVLCDSLQKHPLR
ncbi:hypothetical protein DUI87_08716 [Hirundo rustica rustica]|uniref:Uncharacterized protein n=1 Tax=Hirundo rustica rustica TaxID=333673 RepID=A0A3M0KK65_HIRRU|nr:hypothetical protein DUI87_08716 [Hirundo rustica rustica]